MIRYLMQRPIGVLMAFIACIIAGLALIGKVPVSLLPQADIPQVLVRVSYPNTAAAVVEQNCVKPVREALTNIGRLRNIESKTTDHAGLVLLSFEYGTRMDLACIEVNEKLDRLTNILPQGLPRPLVTRINTSDIPVARIHVVPRSPYNYSQVSELTEKVLRKRLEQLEGVSIVDINGRQQSMVSVTPDKNALSALGTDESVIIQAIRNANRDAGALSVRDGQYRYFIKLQNRLDDEETISSLPALLKTGSVVTLKQLATVKQEQQQPLGYHLYNNRQGLAITVQEQPGSRMNDLMPRIRKAVEQFKKDYPSIHFAITRDQSFLLDAAIGNLEQDLLLGGLLTISLLFLFIGNWRISTLMSISIPVSLIITFALFYFFGISFNIISLSGLGLGIGMLIDNSIVVLDNITRKRVAGMSITDSAVNGTKEVMAPVISQVLTTVAVYAPLILLGGMAGILVWDQSIALTISLGVSLLVAFILSPLLYKLLLKAAPGRVQEDTRFYRATARGYHRMIGYILRHKTVFLVATLAAMAGGLLLAANMPVTALPEIEKKETLARIDWNEPVDAQENLSRINQLCGIIQPHITVSEADVGISQFLLEQDDNTIQKASVYYACETQARKHKTDGMLRQWLQKHYPAASVSFVDAPNAFTQLFVSGAPYLEARFKTAGNDQQGNFAGLNNVIDQLSAGSYEYGAGMLTQPAYVVSLDYNSMALYGVTRTLMEDALQKHFGNYMVSSLRRFGDVRNIYIRSGQPDVEAKLATTVKGYNGTEYPLRNFLSLAQGRQPRFITADNTGEYRSVIFNKGIKDPEALQKGLRQLASANGLHVQFSGTYFDDQAQLRTLGYIFLLVLALLYFILAIQYENLVQPLIVMLTIPLGIGGGTLLLWLAGYSLDVMGAIGFIVILGLIVDDPILKIETLNRLSKEYEQKGLRFDHALLEKMIHQAGDVCLKPLLLVSLTTSIAMVPVLFIGGIGNDLQKPLALVIIGGLTIGTFFTTWFIPLAYWFVYKWTRKTKLNL
jgi:multidrug efflux pump subunit AcrB